MINVPAVPSAEIHCPNPKNLHIPTRREGNAGIARMQNDSIAGWSECHAVVEAVRSATEKIEADNEAKKK